uniref:cysteine dioxygenase n=1 Tax=Araucaria cunninghamii TaxID=56994 RepID=A0A0D6R606_ARACU
MVMMGTSVVQRLYDLCKETFSPAGVVPPEPAVARLKSLMDTIRAVDVGLDEAAIMEIERHGSSSHFGPARRRRQPRRAGGHVAPRARWSPRVTYIPLHECAAFSIGIFCLPTSAIIPLHDHFRMTVFSKILYGTMHVKAYDWLDPEPTNSNLVGLKRATLHRDADFTAPCEPSVLFPATGGNIHSFTAVTSCAVLDVLSPPYLERNPSYYRESPYSSPLSNENGHGEEDNVHYVWLEEIEKPENFILRAQRYSGLVIEIT